MKGRVNLGAWFAIAVGIAVAVATAAQAHVSDVALHVGSNPAAQAALSLTVEAGDLAVKLVLSV